MARVGPRALHVVYCHTPARWLHGDGYLEGRRRARARGPFRARSPPPFAASTAARPRGRTSTSPTAGRSQRRIRHAYGIDATVVYPPVEVERYTPRPRGERLLVISRLLAYKRVDLVVRAASRLGLGLDVVGDGPMLAELRRIAGAGVTFHGVAPQETVVELLEGARAVCVAGEEDFGIVAVEAQAAGKPVVAYARGGALETVRDGVSGVLFEKQTVESLAAAIEACERIDSGPEQIAALARRFDRAAFRRGLIGAIRARMGER